MASTCDIPKGDVLIYCHRSKLHTLMIHSPSHHTLNTYHTDTLRWEQLSTQILRRDNKSGTWQQNLTAELLVNVAREVGSIVKGVPFWKVGKKLM